MMSYFKFRHLFLLLALVLAFVLIIYITMRIQPNISFNAMKQSLPSGVDVALQEVDYTHLQQGLPRWRLIAQQVARDSQSKTLTVSNPSLTFFDDLGNQNGSLSADRGLVDENFQSVKLSANVVLNSITGYTLYTERLIFDNEKNLASTDEYVRIESSGMSLEGQGLIYDLQMKQLQIKDQVNAVFYNQQ
jgi:lipopolysaccharide export system protein LptC